MLSGLGYAAMPLCPEMLSKSAKHPVPEPPDVFEELLLHIFRVREVPLACGGEQVLRT